MGVKLNPDSADVSFSRKRTSVPQVRTYLSLGKYGSCVPALLRFFSTV